MDFSKLAYGTEETGLVVLQDIRLTIIFIAFVLTSAVIYSMVSSSIWSRK